MQRCLSAIVPCVGTEASMAQMRAALDGIPVMQGMATDFRTLRPDDPLSQAVEYLLAGFQQDFPVVEGDRLLGLLTRAEIPDALARYGPDAPVTTAMQREFVAADPREMLQTAFARLQKDGIHTAPVLQNGRLVGLLTADNLAEVLMIQEALRSARNGHPQKPRAAA